MALFVILLPLAAGGGFLGFIQPGLRLIYIILGFSLIIFLHELGHFVVARLCSVKCLAFSIGIGPRLCGWRKNGKLSFGPDPYDRGTASQLTDPKNSDAPQIPHPETGLQSDLPTTAHVAPHAAAIGDCDYRISWLPLGGYVRMLGQDDLDPTKISDDPHSFNRRPIWQRMCIVSAGVVMNLIFAAVCYSVIFSPGIGVGFPPAVIGQVVYGMPAWDQLHLGDQVISIDGNKPRGFLEFTDLQMAAALSDGSTPVHLTVKRAGTGAVEDVAIVPKRGDQGGLLAFGVESIPGMKIADDGSAYTDPDYVAAESRADPTFAADEAEYAKIRKGDKIVAVDDVSLVGSDAGEFPYVKLYNHLQEKNGAPVTLTLASTLKDPLPEQKITLRPPLQRVPGEDQYPAVLGISPQVMIGKPMAGGAAEGKLMEGDIITRVGDRTFPTVKEMIAAIQASPGKEIAIGVLRGADKASASGASATQPAAAGQMLSLNLTPKNASGKGQIGVEVFQSLLSTRFIPPSPDSPIGALNLSPEAKIAAINDQKVSDWQDIYAQLRTKPADESVKITFSDGAAPARTLTVAMNTDEAKAVHGMLVYHLGLHLEVETRDQVASNAGEAVLMGLDHTKKFILNVYMTLAGLFRGTVPADNLHGIVGITKVGYDVQERGPVWLWYVLALVSVNLAVANFLPLPIVDGGLFLLLILEKIRGKPLSMKIQTAIQTVGIVLLAGLFLFVTYNDITGMFLK